MREKLVKPTLFFLDGVAIAGESVALAAQYNEYADVDASRLLLMLDGVWSKVDFDEDVIRSLAFCAERGVLYLLGKSGTVYSIGGRESAFTASSIKGTLKSLQVVDPMDRGELFRVRAKGGRVLACGQGGQLYELRGGSWIDLSLRTNVLDAPDFEDVAVDSGGSPIAVGSGGAVVRFADSGPEFIDSATNEHLSSVVADAEGFFVCGNSGVVFRADGDGMHDLSVDLPPARNLWAIAARREELIVCEPGRLLVK